MFALSRRPPTLCPQDATLDNPPSLHDLAGALLAYARTAAAAGTAVPDGERGLWQRLLQLGHATLGHFFALQGTGDQGDTVTLSEGQTCARLPELHTRRYVSIFGAFALARTPDTASSSPPTTSRSRGQPRMGSTLFMETLVGAARSPFLRPPHVCGSF
jgi:hypothetical protein